MNRIDSLIPGLLALLLCGVALPLAAAGRVDPTEMPPAWVAANPPAAAPGQGPAAGQPGAAAAAPAPMPGKVSVIVVGKRRSLAIVDRQVVHAGDSLDGATVTAIQDSQVAVDDPEKSYKLLPGVEKRPPARNAVRGSPSTPIRNPAASDAAASR